MSRIRALAILCCVVACGGVPRKSPLQTSAHGIQPTPTPSATSSLPATVAAPTQPLKPWLLLTNRDTLQALERHGLDLGALLFATPRAVTTQELSEIRGYRDITREISDALDAARRLDPALGEGMAHAHREFPRAWLNSPSFHFELAAIVNRMDRKVFDGYGCGELRFVYRLVYQATVDGVEVSSRVPMTLNVVAWLWSGNCQEWLDRFTTEQDPSSLALTSPGKIFSLQALQAMSLKSVEINLQSARWPATVRPNMAGHAEYLMRVFQPSSVERPLLGAAAGKASAYGFRAAPMENTPDVARLQHQQAARKQLLEWMTQPEQLTQIDQGTVKFPDDFIAKSALSVAPHGLARLANRPFAQLFSTDSLKNIDLTPYKTFKTPAELLRRLDGLTCTGCHQSRSLAGFHMLGEDDATRHADVLAVAHSAHMGDDLVRRRDYLEALLQGQTPDEFRPPAEHPHPLGDVGEACSLRHDAGELAWGCAEGLHCARVAEADVGQCMPNAAGAGVACETGTMKTNIDSHRDFLNLDAPTDCGAGTVCERSSVGFPAGMCSKSCSSLLPGERCGAIAILTSFNACLARKQPFESCILENSRPAALQACSAEQPCRDDYVCARTADGPGACIPPYFLFQLRVDGHALPPP